MRLRSIIPLVTGEVQEILDKQSTVARTLVVNGFNILSGAVQSDSALFVVALKRREQRKTPEKTSLKATMHSVMANRKIA